MLLRLGRWLRLLGQDVANPEGCSDDALLIQAKREGRTIITRDKRLFEACPGRGIKCVLIRSSRISDQLQEMAGEGVPLQLDPQRCTLCNCQLSEVESEQLRKWKCPVCRKLYWQGGHWKKMESTLESIRSRKDENGSRLGPEANI
jgi:uncharacterized protein with PIN domain